MRLRTIVLYFLFLLAGAQSITESWGAARPVFASPNANAAQIGEYDSRHAPQEISRIGGWIQIIVPSGSLVWIYGRYVNVESGSGEVAADGVRMRPKPSASAESDPLGAFNKGDKVEVVDTQGKWKRVRVFRPVAGWIRAEPQPTAETSSVASSGAAATSIPSPTTSAQKIPIPQRLPSKRETTSNGGSDSRYVIGVSDAINIEIRNLGETEYSLSFRVPSNGMISVPLLDEIKIAGYSPQEIEGIMEQRLSNGYLKGPEVSVRIAEYRPFYINGAVNSPGAFPFQHRLSVQKAIALAGGLTEYGDDSKITVAREGQSSDQAKIVSITTRINPGDVITVGEGVGREKAGMFIYLYGEVKRPGSYEYRAGMTVEKAVALAGGFGDRASKRKISIRRGGTESPEVIKRVKLFAEVEPGDVLTVGQSIF